jgi:hypothetical protein
VPAAQLVAAPSGNSGMQLLKQRHKQERKAFKMRWRATNQSMKGSRISPAIRAMRKHEEQREWRTLREKQKDEKQDQKDRDRLNKENQKYYSQ